MNVDSRRISEVSGNCTTVTSISARNVVSNATPRLMVTLAMAPLMADSSAEPDKKLANPPTAAPSPCTVPMNPRMGITHIIRRTRVKVMSEIVESRPASVPIQPVTRPKSFVDTHKPRARFKRLNSTLSLSPPVS
ncbi:MAG: hypothetical protein BWX54_02400 [Verrucomicrobia bacterium ADurb.Bin018]|nr:MAG: hypothetical protein BWX54_02400 [Verrucomicrobia bacterium ADurb.Bin018]